MDAQAFVDLLGPLLAAVVAGGLIGLEREWRGRAAGFRTHILVCLASAILMELAVTQGDWRFSLMPGQQIIADPARLAHGVLTGIGFLCAGVIFRTGFSIHGLTTAASLWITAALGLVFGAGRYELGLAGAAATLLILVALRLISRRLPYRATVDVNVSWKARGPSPIEAVMAALRRRDPKARSDQHNLAEGGIRSRTFRLQVTDIDLASLAEELARMKGIVAFKLDPRDD